MIRKADVISNIDWITVLVYFALIIMGWANIYAAVFNEEHGSIFDISQRYGKQLIWILVSVILVISILLIDNKTYEVLAYPSYILMLVILVAVLIVGISSHGANSWFEIGDFRVQPAEFAKLTTALALSKYMSTFGFKIKRISHLLQASVFVFIPMALIILQNDAGSALVYLSFIIVFYRRGMWTWVIILMAFIVFLFIAALKYNIFYLTIILPILSVFIFYIINRNRKITFLALLVLISINTVLLIANNYYIHLHKYYVLFIGTLLTILLFVYPAFKMRIKYYSLISIILLGALLFTFSVDYLFNNALEKHQRTRINVVLGLESDPSGVGYNVNQSKIAIGSGGFTGKGYLQGTQTKFDFVPEQETDFIFCTVGEEWGFIGTSVVIILFIVLLLRLIFLAERQKSKFSQLYGYSVVSILFFHIAVNIGMTIGLAPVIGIPLPFFSYGGSSLWAFTILLFIFIRLDASRVEQF